MMKNCPLCNSDKIKNNGSYTRKRNRQKIQRYLCLNKDCGLSFSDQSIHPTYNQKRPDLNQKILEQISSGTGINKTARICRTTKNTVQKKILWLANLCEDFHNKVIGDWQRTRKPRFQFDEFETFEANHVNTLTLPTVVEVDSHFIVDIASARDHSRSQEPRKKNPYEEKYADEIALKPEIIKSVLKACRTMKPEGRIVIESDKKKTYPDYIEDLFGELGIHKSYVSLSDEGKKRLFSINNVIACMRQGLPKVRKKSWHICKSNKMLNAHLKIYKWFHNYFMEKNYWTKIDGKWKRPQMTPAQHLGILDSSIGLRYLYSVY